MSIETLQIYNPEDGCVYFYDKAKSRYRKICDISSYKELPFFVREKILEAKQDANRIMQNADDVLQLPTD